MNQSQEHSRSVTVMGTAGLAAVLAGVLVLSSTATARSAAADPAVSPSESIVVDLADAQDAVKGIDYRVVDYNHRKETDTDDKAIGYAGFTPDGTGVGWIPYGGRLLQIDPSTLQRDPLPAPPIRPDSASEPFYVGDDKLAYVGSDLKSSLTFDRESRQWDRQVWSGLPKGSRPRQQVLGSDDRIYLGMDGSDPNGPPGGTLDLWSINLHDPTDVRDEQLQVGTIARSGDSLVFTDPVPKKSPYLYVRDLATGDERTIDTGTGRTCSTYVAASGNDDIILAQSECPDGYPITAFSVDGTSKVTVTGDGVMFPGGVNDMHLLIYGETGTFTAELDSGRLLKVSDETTYGASFLSGSYVFWHEPTPDTSVIQVVAEMT